MDTDNLTYGTGEDITNNGSGTIQILEASTYEVPVSSSASVSVVTQAVRTELEYELTESTYALPHVYEYATLGPNEQAVIII